MLPQNTLKFCVCVCLFFTHQSKDILKNLYSFKFENPILSFLANKDGHMYC